MNNTTSLPINFPGPLPWDRNQQQQQLIQSGSVPLSDVCVKFPTIIPLPLSTNLFSQSMATTFGEAFEPTPIRENHHHVIEKNPSSSTAPPGGGGKESSICVQDKKDNNIGNMLSLSRAHPSNVSLQSSAASYLSDAVSTTNEEHQASDANQSTDQFSAYQQKHWEQQYRALLKYRRKFGHCRVPHKYKVDVGLARWVKRQRYQYRLRQEGDQTSTMTDYRLKKLEEIGFIWFSHASTWEQRLLELKAFRDENGHCNVPSTYPSNSKLAVWVKCQRRQYKLYRRGKSSHMTQTRIEALEEINFKWELRGQGSLTNTFKVAS